MTLMPETSISLTMIGAGHVATHLSRAFEAAGCGVQTVYSRQLTTAAVLARQLHQAQPTTDLNFRQLPVTDVYFICVPDAAVTQVLRGASFPAGAVVVHTAGSLPLALLAETGSDRTGVFYPIQTFSKDQPVDMRETPIAVEAATPAVREQLLNLARRISRHVTELSSAERKKLHLAAVFACNFTNHLLGIGHELMQQHGLDPQLLHPLIHTTVDKALRNHPFRVQTGPAVRGDENVLADQLAQLAGVPVYQQMYQLISRSIGSQENRPEETKPGREK